MESNRDVKITSRKILNCSNKDVLSSLESPFRLGPLDQLVPSVVPVAVVFVYKEKDEKDEKELIQVEGLERALTLLLDHYPHLTGRLKPDSGEGDGTREIDRLGAGAELLIACCENRLDSFCSEEDGRVSLLRLPDAGNALLPPFDPSPEVLFFSPLLIVQHTRFSCGSVALAVRTLHTTCDAHGYFQLVHDLAEIYRSLFVSSTFSPPSVLALPPQIRSHFSDLSADTVSASLLQQTLSIQPLHYYLEPKAEMLSSPTPSSPSSPPVVAGRFLRFSGSELAKLRAQGTPPDGGWVSTFDVLAAHLYQRIYRARVLHNNSNSSFSSSSSSSNFLTPINIRERLNLSQQYFPNAVLCSFMTLSAEQLSCGQPLWPAAKAVHEMTRSADVSSAEVIDTSLRWMALQADKRRIRHGFVYSDASCMLSQWNKFDMYLGSSFEQPPVLVAPPFTNISLMDGLGYFLPPDLQCQAVDPAAIDVALALSQPVWAFFDQTEPHPPGVFLS